MSRTMARETGRALLDVIRRLRTTESGDHHGQWRLFRGEDRDDDQLVQPRVAARRCAGRRPGGAGAAGERVRSGRHPAGPQGLADFDGRAGSVAPTAAQRSAVAALGARASWTRFGTAGSLIRDGGWLASGLSGDAGDGRARRSCQRNRTLFGLSDAGVAGLQLVADNRLVSSQAHVVLLRQTFGGLPATQDGLISVGRARRQGRLRLLVLGRRRGRSATAPPSPRPQAWAAAAANVGRVVALPAIRERRPSSAGHRLDDLHACLASPSSSRPGWWPSRRRAARPRAAFEVNVVDVRARRRHGLHLARRRPDRRGPVPAGRRAGARRHEQLPGRVHRHRLRPAAPVRRPGRHPDDRRRRHRLAADQRHRPAPAEGRRGRRHLRHRDQPGGHPLRPGGRRLGRRLPGAGLPIPGSHRAGDAAVHLRRHLHDQRRGHPPGHARAALEVLRGLAVRRPFERRPAGHRLLGRRDWL